MTIVINNKLVDIDRWIRWFVITVAMVGTMQLVFECQEKYDGITDAEADAAWEQVDKLPQEDMPEDYAKELKRKVLDEVRKRNK